MKREFFPNRTGSPRSRGHSSDPVSFNATQTGGDVWRPSDANKSTEPAGAFSGRGDPRSGGGPKSSRKGYVKGAGKGKMDDGEGP